MAKEVSIIGTVGLPARYGGFETLVDHLARRLGGRLRITVYCSSPAYATKPRWYAGVRLRYVPLGANGISSIVYDLVSMLMSLRGSDVLIILGVSGCLFLPLVRLLRPSMTVVTNIDGLEWRRDKWSGMARFVLRLSEKFAVRFSHSVVADNDAIAAHVKFAYGRQAHVIPYGGDGETGADAIPPLEAPYAFTVCRIEPENNLELILEAFETTQLPIVVVGNWSASRYGRRLKREYGDRAGYTLLEPIYDAKALNAWRKNAAVYVHGHSAGGTNPSLCEAMYLGLPVCCYDVSFNRYTTEDKAWYFRTAEDLSTLVNAMGPAERKLLAESLHEIAVRRYRWEVISESYRRLIEDGQKP